MANQQTDLRCYLTNAGIAAENNAIALGRKLPIKEMVFGSGLLPDGDDPRHQTALIKEELAVPCVMVTHDDNTTLLTFKGDIPVDRGGFHINEVAVRLEDGTLYNYARSTGDYKPTPEQGATESIRYVVDMYTTNAAVIECKVDLSSVYADYEDLEAVRVEAANNLQAHTDHDDPHSQYEKKDNAATDAEIDAESTASKHVKLSQLWRAFTNKVKDASLTVKGIVKLSSATDSDSELVAATSKAIKLVVDKLTDGFSISLGDTGYIVLPTFLGGFIIQWAEGHASSSASSGYLNTFPLSFPSKCVYAGAIHRGGVASGTHIILVDKTQSSATFKSGYGGTIYVHYFAMGY